MPSMCGGFVSAFLVVYMCSKQHLDPEATVRDHGVGVKVFSKSNQQQCLPEGLFALQHVGICVYRNVRDRERVFVNFQHGGGVFVEVGISEYKCILLCLSCFKHYMELNAMSLIFMLFWTTKKGGSGCLNSGEALPHCDMQPTMI